MSGWLHRALLSNLSLKVVSLVLAVVLYLVVRPGGEATKKPRSHRRPQAMGLHVDSGATPDGSLPRDAGVAAPTSVPTSAPAFR